jgi:hypothetical protein
MADGMIELADAGAEVVETRRRWVRPQVHDMMARAADSAPAGGADGDGAS